jgi:hypothetical protein
MNFSSSNIAARAIAWVDIYSRLVVMQAKIKLNMPTAAIEFHGSNASY